MINRHRIFYEDKKPPRKSFFIIKHFLSIQGLLTFKKEILRMMMLQESSRMVKIRGNDLGLCKYILIDPLQYKRLCFASHFEGMIDVSRSDRRNFI